MKGKMVVCMMGAMLIALPALGRDLARSPRAGLVGVEVMVEELREDADVVTVPDVEDVVHTPSQKSDVGVAVGEIDTVGSTTYDLQWNSAPVQRIAFDPILGNVHLIWTWSNVATPWTDRQVYYNCYIPGTGWVFGQGMDGGTPCQTVRRSGFGTIGLLSDGRAVVALHRRPPLVTSVGVDLLPGGGIFTFVDLSPVDIIWPRICVTANDSLSLCARHSGAGIDEFYYAYSTDMGLSWSNLLFWAPSPDLGNNNFASDISDKVCMTWTIHAPAEPMFNSHLLYAESGDGGQTWGPEINITENIPLPPTGNTYEWYMTRHCRFGGSGIYDSQDNAHSVFAASFGTRTGHAYYYPFLRNPIWHYSPATGASVVAYLSPGVFPEGLGTPNRYAYSYLADGPSLGQDAPGYLYCVWREFPHDLWDVATGFPLGEIYAARSMDGGLTWGPKVNLTMTPTLNEVYPSLAEFVNDTLHLIYQRDYGAGSYVHVEGPLTDNPIVYHNVPVISGNIEVVSIDDPPHWGLGTTSYIGQTYTPKVTYHNKGAETITFQARFEIESPSFFMLLNNNQDTVLLREGLYYDIVDLTLAGGVSTQVEFAPFFVDTFLAPPGGGFRAKLYYTGIASLLGDTDITDNTLLDTCIVDSISPIDTIAVLQVADAVGAPGSSGNPVDIKMDNPMSIAGVQFTVSFDDSLLTADSVSATARTSNMDLGYTIWSDSLKVLVFSTAGDSILPGTGPIVEILFSVDTSAIFGNNTLLEIKNPVLSDPGANPVSCNTINGWFRFGMKGDINGDGLINVVDVVRCVNIILAYPPSPTDYELWASDLNSDGDINVIDVVAIVNIILGREFAYTSDTKEEPTLVNLTKLPGSHPDWINIAIEITNSVPVAGLQLTLECDIDIFTSVKPQTIGRSDDFELVYKTGSGELTILLYDISGDIIKSGTGTVINIPLNIASIRNATLSLKEVILAAEDGSLIETKIQNSSLMIGPISRIYSLSRNYPNPFRGKTEFRFQIADVGTGLVPVRLKIYDLSGRLVKTLVDQHLRPDTYHLSWDGKQEDGRRVSAGIYFYRLDVIGSKESFTRIRKMVLLP